MATQEDVINRILSLYTSGYKGEVCISGKPGTGKSHLIQELYHQMKVLNVTATTNKAAAVLRKTMHTNTIFNYLGITYNEYADTLYKTRRYTPNRRNEVVVIDEASMISRKLYKYIEPLINNNMIIYVGDKYQLPPVNDTFSIFDHVNNTCTLDKVYRQSTDNTINDEVNNIIDSINNNKIHSLNESNNIIFLNKQESLDKLEELFTTNDTSNKCLAYTNKTVTDYNNHIREFMRMHNALTDSGVTGKFPCIDEKVIVNNTVTNKGKPLIIGDTPLMINSLEEMNDYYLINGIYKYPKDVIKHNRLVSKAFKDFRSNRCSQEEVDEIKDFFIDIRPIYASSIHKAQGSTFKNVFLDLHDLSKCRDKTVYNKLLYVAISRAQENVYVFV